MSDAEEPRCTSTHEVVTYIGPTFEASRTEFFRCIREPGHAGNFHHGPAIDADLSSCYATWPECDYVVPDDHPLAQALKDARRR